MIMMIMMICALCTQCPICIDACDGGGTFGSCTVHTCHKVEGLPSPDDATTNYLLKHRGLVVFPKKRGGRGVWIHSMVPGWNCIIIFCTKKCLHGSAALPEEAVKGFALKHLSMFRVVTYPLSRIETLLYRVGKNSEAWETIKKLSDSDTKERLNK